MSQPHHSRRDVLKLLGSVPLVAAAGTAVVTARQVATPKKAQLCLVSRHLQWASIEEGIATAAEAGCRGIAWTVRGGAHIVAENVERDLRKAVELTRKAGLDAPMVITAIVDAQSPRAEAILSTMQSLGIRYFRAPSFRYDYAQELEPQLEALKPRIGGLAALNQKYGTTAMYHTHSGAGNIGGGVWDLWLVLKQFDRELVGLNYDLGHATIRGGTGWVESSHFAHKFVHGLSVKDFRWAKGGGGRRAGRLVGGNGAGWRGDGRLRRYAVVLQVRRFCRAGRALPGILGDRSWCGGTRQHARDRLRQMEARDAKDPNTSHC